VFATLAAPPAAGAAVSLGQTGDPNRTCGGQAYLIQSATEGDPRYAVPSGPYGVITSWSFQGDTLGQLTGRLFVWRPTAAPDQFIYVDSTGQETFVGGAERTFATRLPVQVGDLLGMRAPANCLLGGPGHPAGDEVRFFESATEPPQGSTQTTTGLLSGRILVAANVEPDSDRDGFGDETQDQCPTDAGIQGPCPQPSAPPPPPSDTAASDPPTCQGKPATLVGTDDSDALSGTPGHDVIVGLGGNDKLSGLAGNDLICGGAGKDTLNGGDGNDKLYGKAGKDTLKGGPGRDKLKGGPGKDKLKGGPGKDKQAQ
jgi:Ca2+-binding RTX toxin-like protein